MGEKGFSQSGWRETNHQLNLQKKPTSSVLKPPVEKGGCDASGCCFSAILSTPDERSKPRGWVFFQIFVGICTLILQEKCVEMVFQNWRFYLWYHIQTMDVFFLNFLECPIMTWKTHLWPPDLWSSHLSRPRFCGASTSCSPNGPSKCCP